MSSDSSPVHLYQDNFTSKYSDPEFTALISAKMQVPDRISIHPEYPRSRDVLNFPPPIAEPTKLEMKVPNRIVVMGSDKHAADKNAPFELKLSNYDLPQESNYSPVTQVMQMKPEDSFPNIENTESPVKIQSKQFPINGIVSNNEGNTIIRESPSCDLEKLVSKMAFMDHRILILEEETALRKQREFIACALGATYILLKTLIWLNRNW